jgi:hypothetical protein
MKVEVSSDKPIEESLRNSVVSIVEAGLDRFSNRLTRAEVHLRNVDAAAGRTPECTLEARPASREPVAVGHGAAGVEEAVAGAAEKMERLLDSLFDRLDSHRGGPSASGQPT